MIILLDTHAFLYFIAGGAELKHLKYVLPYELT